MASEGWTDDTITGEIVEVDASGFMKVKDEQGHTRKIWKGRRYKGPKPPGVGSWITAAFSTAPDQGQKRGSNYLNSWEPVDAPATLSVVPSQIVVGEEKRFVGREPGTADYFHAMRWAYSLAADLYPRKDGVPVKVVDLRPLAGELFYAAHDDALEEQEKIEYRARGATAS